MPTEPDRNPEADRADDARNRALGRIAEHLLDRDARVPLNAVRDALEDLRRGAYRAGYDAGRRDAEDDLDDRDNDAAERLGFEREAVREAFD